MDSHVVLCDNVNFESVKNVIICDINGTLSDASHREYLVSGGRSDWDKFYELAKDDPVKPVTRDIINSLGSTGYEIHLLTGSHRKYEDDKILWLDRHDVSYHTLHVPRYGERAYHQSDDLKRSWLMDQSKAFFNRIACCLEDRDRDIEMWKDCGLVCWQVA